VRGGAALIQMTYGEVWGAPIEMTRGDGGGSQGAGLRTMRLPMSD
jgi:hypothetical protein